MEKEPEAAGTQEGDPADKADLWKPQKDKSRPAVRKRRRRPKKSDKPGATGREVGEESQPAAKKGPGRPRKKPAADTDEYGIQ